MDHVKAKKVAKEIQEELTEEYQIDISGVDVSALASIAGRIPMFDDAEYPTMAVIIPKLTSKTESQSFAIVDLGAIIRQYRKWKQCLPNVEVFYAVKCNPDKFIIETLAKLGCGFDVASKGEIALVTDLVDPNRNMMIYANPCKGLDHIKYARSRQISMMTFDNIDELLKIKLLHPDAKLVLRLLVDNKDHHKSKMPFGFKFGCPMRDVKNVLEFAKYLELDVIGVSFHVGSGCFDATAYSDALKQTKETFDIAKGIGFVFNLVDIGGGFPGIKTQGEASFEEMAEVINKEIQDSFRDVENLRVIGEPGRFFATSAMTIVTSITGKKRIIQLQQKKTNLSQSPDDNDSDDSDDDSDDDENESKKRCCADDDKNKKRRRVDDVKIFHYYINSSLYNMFNNIIFDKATPEFKLLNRYDDNTMYKSVIFGET